MTESVNNQVQSRPYNPAWCGVLWGGGLATAIVQFRLLRSESIYTSLGIILAYGPLISVALALGGGLLYRQAARRFHALGSRYALVGACVGAVALVAGPRVMETWRLHAAAAVEIPTYPGTLKRQTDVRWYSGQVTVRLQTPALDQEVMNYYLDFWKRRGWTSDRSEETSGLSLTRGGEVMHLRKARGIEGQGYIVDWSTRLVSSH